jgi:hypothetical protein
LGGLLREFVRRFIRKSELVVVYEEPFLRGIRATQALERMVGALQLVCEEEGVEYVGVNLSTVRKDMGITGKRREDFKANIAAWGGRTYPDRQWKSQDEVDAALTANWLRLALEKQSAQG